MSEIRKLFKLLLKKDFYKKHSKRIPTGAFDEVGQDLLETLKIAHEKFDRDLTENELVLIHVAQNPTITTANKNTIEAYLHNVKNEEDVKEDVADLVYSSMWRNECGRYISEFGINFADGRHDSVDGLLSYIQSIGKDFIPEDFGDPVDTDPINLFNRLNQRGKWTLNIPTLNQRIGNISPGQFIILLARPETGKTAAIVHMMSAKDGFASQGAKTHLLANEEGADVTAGRAICCFNELSFKEVRENPSLAKTEEWEKTRKNLVFLHKPDITITQLDQYCKENEPDVLIIDQLDHINISGYEKGHEKLAAIYRRTRELASIHNCVIIGICQASAEADGKTKINFSMAEGSRTGKAAAADIIIGIGKPDSEEMEEGEHVLRYFTVSKNKVSGWHGTSIVKLIKNQSRFIP